MSITSQNKKAKIRKVKMISENHTKSTLTLKNAIFKSHTFFLLLLALNYVTE